MTGLPDSMMAISAEPAGGPDVLQPKTVPIPRPGHGDVLIQVAAAGLNRADLSQRSGSYGARSPTPKPPGVLGLEVSGTVAAVGEGVTNWTMGDPVCALINSGGYAEFAIAPAAQCLPVPKAITLVDAAGLPEACIRALGSPMLATAGTAEKCRRCEDLSADRAIDYTTEDFVKVVHDATGGTGVDVILEMVGGDYLERDVRAMAPGGRLAITRCERAPRSNSIFPPYRRKMPSSRDRD